MTPWNYAAQLFATQWTTACQASLSFTTSRRLLKPMSTESVMPSSHLILCHPLLLPSIFPSSGKGSCAEITIKTVLGSEGLQILIICRKKLAVTLRKARSCFPGSETYLLKLNDRKHRFSLGFWFLGVCVRVCTC